MYFAIRTLMITFFLWSTSAGLKLSEYDKNHSDTILEWHNICEDVTGVKDIGITKLKAGDFTDNVDMKKYLLCMWRVSGIMNTDLEFRKKILEQYVPKRMDTKNEMDMVQSCLDQGKQLGREKYDKIFEMQECLYKKNPNDILMF